MDSSHRFFFAVTSLFRFAINLGFLERPLTVGFIWALCTGEWQLAMSMALFYELFWLDLFPAGTYIPPNSAASLLLGIGVAHYYGISAPTSLAVPMLLSLPAALVAAKLEHWQRRSQNAGYNRLIWWGRHLEENNTPGAVLFWSLVQLAVIHALFISVCLLVLIGTINLMALYIGHLPTVPGVGWPHLWFGAAIGGILSLRVPRSYLVFLLCLLCVMVILNIPWNFF